MSDTTSDPCLMPLPQHSETLEGAPLRIHGRFEPVYVGARTVRLERAVVRFAATRAAAPADGPVVPLVIECGSAGAEYPALGDEEGYVLTVDDTGMRISAAMEWGVLRALATLTQLCTARRELAPVRITDAPRFAWRGLMLDVARHFIPVSDLLRTLDAMAVFKLNVLHLHLSDDQAFRFPSRRYPRLPAAQHYAVTELRDLVAQAADRGIRVVPELDVPGHATSWLQAYPEWGNRAAEPSRRFGVHGACLDPTRGEVLEAVEALFAELMEVFPDHYLHIGGDEVHPAWWSEDARVAAHMDAHGLADAAALQARFNRHLADGIRRLGRSVIGWDEVLHPDLPAEVTVQSWRGATARDRALGSGHHCVVSAPYYLDLFLPVDVHYAFDPAAPQDQLLAQEDALLADARLAHIAAGMAWTKHWRQVPAPPARDQRGSILGAEACLWSELVDARVLDVRLWSRMPALAERFWSPAQCRDPDDLYRRLSPVLERLPLWTGVDVRGDARRLTLEAGLTEAWRPLAEVLEPVKWYGRLLGEEALSARLSGREMPQARPYDADSPLDRVVDALPPESLATRDLQALTRAEAGGDAQAGARLASLAQEWRSLPEEGGPVELEEAAERLRQLGTLVLDVLADRVPARLAAERLHQAAKPTGEYILAPALVLGQWLEARSRLEPHDG